MRMRCLSERWSPDRGGVGFERWDGTNPGVVGRVGRGTLRRSAGDASLHAGGRRQGEATESRSIYLRTLRRPETLPRFCILPPSARHSMPRRCSAVRLSTFQCAAGSDRLALSPRFSVSVMLLRLNTSSLTRRLCFSDAARSRRCSTMAPFDRLARCLARWRRRSPDGSAGPRRSRRRTRCPKPG
jgi:hypothetical protein